MLPSGPDGVHDSRLRGNWPSTPGHEEANALPHGGLDGSRPGREYGGDERDRTADLLVANEALSQLSYIPTESRVALQLAEREGFEPSKHFHAYTVSNRAPSATRTPLREASNLSRAPTRASSRMAEREGFEPSIPLRV